MSIRCFDQCGAPAVPSEDDAQRAGWQLLASSGRYRCPDCADALRRAAGYVGRAPDATFVDRVPPDSRGALPKATAESIAAPVVRP